MAFDICLLDYVWRGLSAGAISTAFFLGVMSLAPRIARGGSAQVAKWFFNVNFLAMSTVFVGSFFYLAAFDRDLAVGCFRDFARDNGAMNLTRLLAEAWLGSIAVLLTFDLVRIFVASLNVSGLVRNHDLDSTVLRLKERLGMKREVAVHLTERPVSPYVCGFLRPKIVIPRDLLATPELLEGILAHELVHVRERDSLWLYFELVLRRVLFFNPLMYVLARDYRACVERAADEQAVLRGGVNSHSLVQSLLHVAAHYHLAPAHFEPAVSRGFHEIKQRIEALAQLTPFRWSRNLIFFVAPLVSISGALAQTRGTAVKIEGEVREEVRMCRQVSDEQVLRSWLKWQDTSNKCEK